MRRDSPRGGFTLVEIMLAVLILAIFMGLVYEIVVITIKRQELIEEMNISGSVGTGILSQMRRDLEGAFLTDPEQPQFVGLDRNGPDGDHDRIDFISGVMAFGAEEEGDDPTFHSVNEVGYQVQRSRENPDLGVLYRREDLFVDREPLRGGLLTELHDRVRHFGLSYWDGEEWRETWDNEQTKGRLPRAVRIELRIASRGASGKDIDRTYRTTVTFPELPEPQSDSTPGTGGGGGSGGGGRGRR